MAFLCGLSIVGSFLLVFLSIYPGMLPDLGVVALISSPIWLPATIMVGAFFLDLSREIVNLATPSLFRKLWVLLTMLILCVNSALLWCGAPRRLAFIVSRPAFGPYVASTPVPQVREEMLDRWLGVFHVEQCATDPRGGVYFRTHGGLDGLGPRTMWYGFAYKPNPIGSPFGNAKYALSSLIGDWYCFAALNDE